MVPAPPMSTLGAMASQSVPVAQPARPRRPWLAVVLGVVAAAVIGIVIVTRQQAPTAMPQGEARDLPGDTTIASASAPAPAPVHVPTPTLAHDEAEAVAVHVADAGPPALPPVATITATTSDAGPTDTPELAAHPHDAVMPDADIKATRAEPVVTGHLKVVILPWAEVWVDGKRLGQTPVRARVSVGPHRVRLKNDATEKTVTVTVTSGKTTVIDETW
jgi:serine/threonine-protein kinase